MSVLNDLGTCCACGGTQQVRNIICLNYKAKNPAMGWGCVVCHVSGGASAVLCDTCIEEGAQIKFVIDDYPYKNLRIPIEEVEATKFDHDYAFHPDQWWFKDSPNAGDPACICSVCRKVIEYSSHGLFRLIRPYGEFRAHDECFVKVADKLKDYPPVMVDTTDADQTD